MRRRLAPALAALTLATGLALAGCGGAGASGDAGAGNAGGTGEAGDSAAGSGGGAYDGGGAYEYGEPEPTGSVALTTAESDLGTIVVDGAGMTVYMFDSDTQGAATSVCTGQCLANWPPATTEATEPELEGVTGAVGTIDTPDGAKQLTLDGWPLYHFSGDQGPGDVNGQGLNGVWWVLSPSGARITG